MSKQVKVATEKRKRKMYVVGGNDVYANWTESLIVPTMEEADWVMFTGGEDVSPYLYGQNPHPLTKWNNERDGYEMIEFKKAKGLDKKLIGICRGSQFLCVMAGGMLVQHQSHPNPHHILWKDRSGPVLEVNSYHHQRQNPWGLEDPFIVIGWCEGLSPINESDPKAEFKLNRNHEVEVAYYPRIKALCIQCHPEMMDMRSRAIKEFRKEMDLIDSGEIY